MAFVSSRGRSRLTVGPALHTTIGDLVDSTGAATGIGLVVTDAFKFTNASGQPLPTGEAMEFWQGSNDSLYPRRPIVHGDPVVLCPLTSCPPTGT